MSTLNNREFSVRYNKVMSLLDEHLITKGELNLLIVELGRCADNVAMLEHRLEEKIRKLEERLVRGAADVVVLEYRLAAINSVFWTCVLIGFGIAISEWVPSWWYVFGGVLLIGFVMKIFEWMSALRDMSS